MAAAATTKEREVFLSHVLFQVGLFIDLNNQPSKIMFAGLMQIGYDIITLKQKSILTITTITESDGRFSVTIGYI